MRRDATWSYPATFEIVAFEHKMAMEPSSGKKGRLWGRKTEAAPQNEEFKRPVSLALLTEQTKSVAVME